MTVRNRVRAGVLAAVVLAFGLPVISASVASAAATPSEAIVPSLPMLQPVPGHTGLVPDVPRTNTPRINSGEIWDIEVVPQLNRVFIAGSFSSIQNNVSGNTTTINQSQLASYNMTTGLIDTNFRPTFGGGGVSAVEATPDGTKLFVGGTFSTVGGQAKQKVASLNLSTGAPLSTFAFANSTNNGVTALAATNSTLYVGGRYTRINGVLKSGLAAVNATTGAVDASFSNDISGGIGVNGVLQVQQLKLTHDDSLLLVEHTGRKIAGQDRLTVGIIDTATKQLLPWRTQLWDTNLARLGGVTRIYSMDVAPNDQYFVVGSGSGGDAPPISDTAVAYSLSPSELQNSDAQPIWNTRNFDSVYSIAITETAVYIGGHFQFTESQTACGAEPCYPGLENVGYGTGQGLSGYGLGDAVVRRDHLAALDPTNGRALEWYAISNSFEGDKAMEATPRGLFVGGDGQFKGGIRTGRVGFFDFNSLPAPSTTDTGITAPIEGRVIDAANSFSVDGTATSPQGVRQVKVQIKDTSIGRWLHTDGTWGSSFAFNATLNPGSGANRTWTLPLDIPDTRVIQATAWTIGTNGVRDTASKATQKFETFSFEDQTPTTTVTGPSGIQTSTSFTVTGTATDDHGVNRISLWFRDENNQYLQPDGTVAPIFNTFSAIPDVVGATNATWSYDLTLPHEGIWRLSATAIDDAGQADLRSGVRDVTVNSNAIAPSVTLSAPVDWAAPAPAPASFTVQPGQPITFSGTATDDEAVQLVEITLRNTTTRENLGADGTWGVNVISGQRRISPQGLNAPSYNWSYTTPFNLSPGSYSFTVRATDNDELTTASGNQGRLSFTAQIPGDTPPDTLLTNGPVSPFTITDPNVSVAGSATDDQGVESVRLTVVNNETGRYLQDNDTYSSTYNTVNANMSAPNATSTNWTYNMTVPGSGDFRVTAFAFDTGGQQDLSTTGATARYMYHPNDLPPGFESALGQPVSGAAFDQGKIVVTGRAIDDISIAQVQVGIVDSLGRYMSGSGTFTSTTPSFRTAFLNSPGSPGSNFSYTTPVIPDGTYEVRVQSIDSIGQISVQRISTGITVTHPANNPPVPSFTYSCDPSPDANICTFDGRSSTDENPTALTYSWSFGTQGTATGPLPTKTFTAAGTFAVTLTVRDEWNVSATSAAQNVTITEPPDNAAPVPTFTTGCTGVTCAVSSTGTADPNAGDTFIYSWNWGDGTALSTGATPSAHTYAAPGNYTITLTTTDGWGKFASTTRNVSLVEPAGNQPPTPVFTATCATFTVCQTNSAGTADPDSDAIRYSWNWGDNTTASTTANPSHTYSVPGSYTITLTATDVWGKFSTVSHDVTITEPASNNAPTAVIASGTCATFTTCQMSATGSSDPDTATGDGIRNYVWSWGDGMPDTTGTSASQSHVYQFAGSYTVTLRVLDKWGRSSAPVTMDVTTQPEPAGNQPPTVVFAQPSCNVRTCSVSAAGTVDSDGGIRNYMWEWGDLTTPTTTTGQTSSHTYAAAGTYIITLTVTDNWGRTNSTTRSVTVT